MPHPWGGDSTGICPWGHLNPPPWAPPGWAPRTSRISLILQPPLPMRDPHWLAGTTSRRVTGGRLAAVLLVMELLMSCEEEEVLRARPCWDGTRWGRAWHRDREATLAPVAQAKVTSGLSQSRFPGLPQQPRKNRAVFWGSSSQTLLPQWKWVQALPQAGSHLSQAGTSAGGEQGTRGGSGTLQLQGQHRASRCIRDQGSSSGKNNPGADYSGHVLAGGGEAQGQGSTDLLKAKLQLQGRCPERCRAVQPLEDSGSQHMALTGPSSAAFKAVVGAGGSGDRAASTGLFLPW